jgi:NRPS condensation-like uncharacterized protein
MTQPKGSSILLTEADCFMHTLEKRHINRTGVSTNICRYLLELEGRFDADKFLKKINAYVDILWLASLMPHKTFPLALPEWISKKKIIEIPLQIHYSDELMPETIINRGMHMDESHISLDVIYRTNGNSALIFSWHHLIMDGYGVVLLLKQLANGSGNKLHYVIDNEAKDKLGLRKLANATRAKFFVDRISKKPLTSIAPSKPISNRNQKLRVIRFTEEQSAIIDKNGPVLGAQFGRSAIFLASAARGVKNLLVEKGVVINDFWIPVPKDQRKKGADGPLLGNHLSFLFYRLKADDLNSLKRTVRSVNAQMVEQIKSGMSRDYDILMTYLRRTPTPLYYFWIKGPQGGSLASFLFTVAADHPNDFLKFEGHNIKDAWSFPSGIYPPGLSFAFMRFQEKLHIMIMYFEDVISEKEIDQLEMHIKQDLLTERNHD